jgi:hypothetical protein
MSIYTKQQLDDMLSKLGLSSSQVNTWWNSPNKAFGDIEPIIIYMATEQGEQDVTNYILTTYWGDY